jgi:hypothetical protein
MASVRFGKHLAPFISCRPSARVADDGDRHDPLEVGERVIKDGGDYTFEGVTIAVFKKRSGAIRYAVEDDRGIVMIMNPQQLRKPAQTMKELETIPVGHLDEEPRIDIHLHNQYGEVWVRLTEKELRYLLEIVCQNSAK